MYKNYTALISYAPHIHKFFFSLDLKADLSHIFKNLVNKQLYNDLDENKFIYRHQSGFRCFTRSSHAYYQVLMIGTFISIKDNVQVWSSWT